ncbi:PASTA domain-containing protein [Nocardioides deserti]|uniref:PASTA domain-containing protein n=1 Tax=Nocardioides deserti TaxID=1588644 RepID=A0ABR6U4A5_9ACTN|nr:PASTA domain-containing protein [Nocardioides deserti]MBC2959013.1 PASTA domain-containing protein [Nocardioides deserti]GGO68978.1 hypothetical protein GCM10012276_04070 [Nocardioides deserti]
MSNHDRDTSHETAHETVLRRSLTEAVPPGFGPLDATTIRGRASRERRRRRAAWAGTAVLAVAAVGLAAPVVTDGWDSGPHEQEPAAPGLDQVTVPSLDGLPLGEATKVATRLGLRLDAGEVTVESMGHVVLDQAPAGDTAVARGTTVTVEVGLAGGAAEAGLTVRNRAGAPVYIEDDEGMTVVEPGKVMAYIERDACDLGPLRAIVVDGFTTIAVHKADCIGETWVVRPQGPGVVLPPGAASSGR